MLGKEEKVKAREIGPEAGGRGREKPQGRDKPGTSVLGQEFRARSVTTAGRLQERLQVYGASSKN